MKVLIRGTKEEANRIAGINDKVVKFGKAFAVVSKNDYLEFLYNAKENKK